MRNDYLLEKAELVSGNLSDSNSGASLGSLVPAGSDRVGDDSSYVNVRNSIASPPSSLNTCTDLSLGDMVLVRAESRELNDLDDTQST